MGKNGNIVKPTAAFRHFEASVGHRLAHLSTPRHLADRSREAKIASVHNLVYEHTEAAAAYFRVANMETAILGHSDCECCFPGLLEKRNKYWAKILCKAKAKAKRTTTISSVLRN